MDEQGQEADLTLLADVMDSIDMHTRDNARDNTTDNRHNDSDYDIYSEALDKIMAGDEQGDNIGEGAGGLGRNSSNLSLADQLEAQWLQNQCTMGNKNSVSDHRTTDNKISVTETEKLSRVKQNNSSGTTKDCIRESVTVTNTDSEHFHSREHSHAQIQAGVTGKTDNAMNAHATSDVTSTNNVTMDSNAIFVNNNASDDVSKETLNELYKSEGLLKATTNVHAEVQSSNHGHLDNGSKTCGLSENTSSGNVTTVTGKSENAVNGFSGITATKLQTNGEITASEEHKSGLNGITAKESQENGEITGNKEQKSGHTGITAEVLHKNGEITGNNERLSELNGSTATSENGEISDNKSQKSEKSGTTENAIVDAPDGAVPTKPRLSLFGRKVSNLLKQVDLENCSPDVAVGMLRAPTMQMLASLNRKLKTCEGDWMTGFLEEGGLETLLDMVDSMSSKRVTALAEAMVLLECVACIKTLMNSRMGLDFFVLHPDCTHKLVKGKLLCFTLFASLSS